MPGNEQKQPETTFYRWDGQPARRRGEYAVPEVYHGDGEWGPYDDGFDTGAVPITEAEAEDLIKAWDA